MLTYTDYIESFNRALDDEIEFAREAGGKRYRLTDGDLLAGIGSGWIYLFHMDYELFLPDDTPVRIEINAIPSGFCRVKYLNLGVG